MLPPETATIRPARRCAVGDEPVATTVPAPSLPTGSDSPSRAASAWSMGPGTAARTTGCSGVPPSVAVLRSAPASSSPRSDGLTGAASTRTRTSSGPGSGTGPGSSDTSRVPSAFSSDRICSCPVSNRPPARLPPLPQVVPGRRRVRFLEDRPHPALGLRLHQVAGHQDPETIRLYTLHDSRGHLKRWHALTQKPVLGRLHASCPLGCECLVHLVPQVRRTVPLGGVDPGRHDARPQHRQADRGAR